MGNQEFKVSPHSKYMLQEIQAAGKKISNWFGVMSLVSSSSDIHSL